MHAHMVNTPTSVHRLVNQTTPSTALDVLHHQHAEGGLATRAVFATREHDQSDRFKIEQRLQILNAPGVEIEV